MTVTVGHDSAKTRKTLTAGGQTVSYYSIPAAEAAGLGEFSKLPAALKVVLENMLRFEDGKTVSVDDIKAFSDWGKLAGKNPREIAYRPARVLMQDFTGVPAVVDLAAMRDGIKGLGGDAQRINPLAPVDLVIDHSVMIDEFGTPRAFQANVDREYERNMERYVFLKWGQNAFNNFRVVPPGTGICHQVNLEYLAQTVWTKEEDGEIVAFRPEQIKSAIGNLVLNALLQNSNLCLQVGKLALEIRECICGWNTGILADLALGTLLGYEYVVLVVYATERVVSSRHFGSC